MEFAYKPLAHVSASQITTFRLCRRKHWLEKIGGIFVPPSAGAEFGTRGHAAIEHRIQTGRWPDDRAAVAAAVTGWQYIPPPPLLVEAEMRLEGCALPIVGRIDLIAPDSSLVIDHKFLSSFRWAKTAAQLAEDPQAILYVMWAWQQGYLSQTGLSFQHIVYQSGGEGARPTKYTFQIGELRQRFGELSKTIDQVCAEAAKRNPADVAGAMESADPSPCKAYGGCPHYGICAHLTGRSAWKGLESKKGVEMESLLDRLAKKKASQTGAAAASAGDVNPPEAGSIAATSPVAASAAKAPAQEQPDLFAFPPSDAEMAEYAVEQAKQPAPPPQDSRLSDPLQYKTLYIGCMPFNEAVITLDAWLQPLLATAAQSLGVPHYGMAEYGKGKPALAALVAHKATVEGVPLVMVADPRMPSSDLALEVLRPLYDRVVVRFG